jgi:hypothetical protein
MIDKPYSIGDIRSNIDKAEASLNFKTFSDNGYELALLALAITKMLFNLMAVVEEARCQEDTCSSTTE